MPKWTLTNRRGAAAEIVSTGASLASFRLADQAELVVHPHGDADFATNPAYLGCVVGRYANRIAGARCRVDGTEYCFVPNQNGHALHGGADGWHVREWVGAWVDGQEGRAVRLSLHSPDGDGGFPGAVDVSVRYGLDDADRLTLDFHAESDAATPFNITHHGYWNLSGGAAATIMDHDLTVFADRYLPVDAEAIPTGAIAPVAGALDWRTPQRLGAVLDPLHPALLPFRGLDHCFVGPGEDAMRLMAMLRDPGSGRTLTVLSDQPGLQVYSGQWLGSSGSGHVDYAGIALETQHFPDSPNRPAFPDTIMRPGRPFRSRTVYALSSG